MTAKIRIDPCDHFLAPFVANDGIRITFACQPGLTVRKIDVEEGPNTKVFAVSDIVTKFSPSKAVYLSDRKSVV